MKKTLIVLFLSLMILSGCNLFNSVAVPAKSPYPDDVPWETAVKILNSSEVEMVTQLHNLDVILTLMDGTEIATVEPVIDDIFHEVERCGLHCSNIIIATE